MGKRYLIDSNVLIEYMGLFFPHKVNAKITAIIDKEFNISFVNKIEVLGHASAGQTVVDFIGTSNIYYIDDEIINQTIKLRKFYNIKLPDAIIAATAIVYNFILLTRNINDFKNIKELKIVNPSDWIKSS